MITIFFDYAQRGVDSRGHALSSPETRAVPLPLSRRGHIEHRCEPLSRFVVMNFDGGFPHSLFVVRLAFLSIERRGVMRVGMQAPPTNDHRTSLIIGWGLGSRPQVRHPLTRGLRFASRPRPQSP